ncbi:MAG: hydrogenase maturation protease [Candidatus Coatesbacteria bacterium]
MGGHPWFGKRVLVLGCGNVLFGDDGFGPEVAGRLVSEWDLPGDVAVLDAGTGAREILFDLALGGPRPEKLVIVDAVLLPSRGPGEVFTLGVEELPAVKRDDFALHQAPSVDLLRELSERCGVRVTVVAAQVTAVPDEVAPGLSVQMTDAVGRACRLVVREALG